MDISFTELLEVLDGEIIVEGEKKDFNAISIDTRKIQNKNIFLAIKGENFNGNNYVENAFNKGASIAIVDEILFNVSHIKNNGTVIKVDNTYNALMRLAKYYREKLGITVIGVTGSCGKTSTKDIIAALLSNKYKVFKTKGNFNNHIGLPLMILELNKEYDIAVLEMGMSNLGEIHLLADIARPDLGVITNIGLSHIENLKTQENILKAKMEITDFFNLDNELIINGEDEMLNNIHLSGFKISRIGYNHEYDVYCSNIILEEENIEFTANIKERSYDFKLPMAGKHNVLNAMLAIKVADSLGLSFEEMEKGIKNIEPTSMRLQVIKKDKFILINDCYNASPDSMKSSMDVLNTYKNGRKVAILGTMNELGHESNNAHEDVAKYAGDKVDLLIAIGKYKDSFKAGYKGKEIITYDTKEEFIKDAPLIIKKNDILLVKASRGMKFEDIVKSILEVAI